MKKHILVLAFLTLLITACSDFNLPTPQEIQKEPPKISEYSEYKVEAIATNLFVPWSIVFTDENRILVSERNGKIRVIIKEKLQEKPLHIFQDISSQSEEGLMGMALDPNYTSNKYLYLCLAYPKGNALFDKILRFKDNEDHLSDETVIVDNIPAARYHAGCRLQFGPDEKLYITTGDATERNKAQNLNVLNGKILRINPDGSIPKDNPYKNSPIWSYGHRNPQGIDWYPGTDILYETEHGPSTFDGPPGGDEVNIIKKGENYGWPLVSHENNKKGLIAPKLVFTPAEAPASGMFYTSDKLPQFTNTFLFGTLKGEGIIKLNIDEEDPRNILSHKKLFHKQYGRIREIAQSPNGDIYFSTSNRDGRGPLFEGDDKIYKISIKR